MPEDFPPPGWFLRPESWPYWMPNSPWGSPFTLPTQQNYSRDLGLSTSPPSLEPSIPTGGILGNFGQPDESWADRTPQMLVEPPGPTSWTTSALPLEHLDSAKYWGSQLAGASERPLADDSYLPRAFPKPNWESAPRDVGTASTARLFSEPFGPTSWATPRSPLAYLDSARSWGSVPTMPQSSIWDAVPRNLAGGGLQPYLEPSSPSAWDTAAPPLERLYSGNYGPRVPAPSSANDQLLAHGVNSFPTPQARNWEPVPTHPAINTAQILPTLPIRNPAQDPATVASDADPEAWLLGRHYAQNQARRGTRGPGGRDLSPMEEIHIWLYNGARTTLRELDPRNPHLESLSTSTWVPTNRDINQLNGEIARVRGERGLSELEPHHNLPRQFSYQFNRAGINVDDYVLYMPRNEHRLLPSGLHTGSNHWNAQWRRFFNDNPNASPDQIFEHANNMLKQLPR